MTREDVEEYLHFAAKAKSAAKFCIRVSPEDAKELCKAWLALDAAPEVTVSKCCGHLNITDYPADEVPSEITELEGQRVRLVPTHGAGGDANLQGGRKP